MNSRSRGILLTPVLRGVSVLLFGLLVAVVLDTRPQNAGAAPPTAVRTQPPTKTQPDKKEPDKKDMPKAPEIKWPTEISGKDIHAWMKDMEHTDPTIREFAARTIPQFGPAAQKGEVSKLLIKRMQAEKDPGVRGAIYNAVGQLQFENEADNKEALRLLVVAVDTGMPGGMTRLRAIQTITMFGPKGEGAVTVLTGKALGDPSYETRRTIAHALGRVGFNEKTGPNMRALTNLADRLARDDSAAVRMEALQSLLLLGPPWAAVMKPGAKVPPPIKAQDAATIIRSMRVRIGDPKTKTEAKEKDKQVEIWARLVLMRFDPKEVNEENLDALANCLTDPDIGVKVQALQAISIIGQGASKKLSSVVRVLEDKTAPFPVTVASIQVLMTMGAGAKPALPNLQKMANERKKELDAKKIELAKNDKDLKLIADATALDELVKLLEGAIKHIDGAKPLSPALTPSPGDNKKP
jgi:HEAT repeat protein